MLSTKPYKGVRDFFPENLKIRDYIFDTWRQVCRSFGYEEYDGPFLEPFELFESKSGQELVNEQLYSFEDKGGRKVAIRPEMTPTVSRMAAERIRNQYPTPIKWFSIADFYRYEKPQKGRGREFFQLNIDIFGEEGAEADLEMILVNTEIMKAFGAKPSMYQVRINNRYLTNFLLSSVAGIGENLIQKTYKILDKKAKISQKEFEEGLMAIGLTNSQAEGIKKTLDLTVSDLSKLPNLPGDAKSLLTLFELMEELGIPSVVYDPTVVRGLDYYDGNVFEQYDMSPDNTRSMFGGGRYNGLISLFLDKDVPAVGFAQGDITMIEFLKGWDILPKFGNDIKVLVSVFPSSKPCLLKSYETANLLRKDVETEIYLNGSEDLTKQVRYADRKNIPFVVIIGPDELQKGTFTVKELATNNQKEVPTIEDILKLVC